MEISFDASLDKLREMVHSIKQYAVDMGFSGPVLSRIELVAEEVLVNIISYGYEGKKGKIYINCSQAANNVLKILIKDQGIPFNPLSFSEVNTEASLEEATYGGYGIHLLRKVMDEVVYHHDGQSNILTMTISRS